MSASQLSSSRHRGHRGPRGRAPKPARRPLQHGAGQLVRHDHPDARARHGPAAALRHRLDGVQDDASRPSTATPSRCRRRSASTGFVDGVEPHRTSRSGVRDLAARHGGHGRRRRSSSRRSRRTPSSATGSAGSSGTRSSTCSPRCSSRSPCVALPQIQLTGLVGLDNPVGVIILHIMFQLSFSVLLFTAFLRSIPIELEESARIDGASTWQTFWQLIFPLLAPMSATVGIFAFLYAWNDFMMPSLIIADPALQTLPVRADRCSRRSSATTTTWRSPRT